VSGAPISETGILLSLNTNNKVSVYNWSMGYSYELLHSEKPIIATEKRYKYSALSLIKNDRFSKVQSNFFAVVNTIVLTYFQLDLINPLTSKKVRVKRYTT
jgi:hypothetical protein